MVLQQEFIVINGRLYSLISELYAIAGVERSRTSLYHPIGNGQCKCFSQVLLKMMGTMEEYQKSDWKAHVLY